MFEILKGEGKASSKLQGKGSKPLKTGVVADDTLKKSKASRNTQGKSTLKSRMANHEKGRGGAIPEGALCGGGAAATTFGGWRERNARAFWNVGGEVAHGLLIVPHEAARAVLHDELSCSAPY